jgi:hypothetical protein
MNYKTECPKCAGNDFYVTPSNGVGYCFHCGHYERSGSEKESYKITYGIEALRSVYTSLASSYHSNLGGRALAYLYSRGYTPETIDKLKLGYIPDEVPLHLDKVLARDTGLFANGKSILGGRVSFPYLVNGIVTDIRGRSLDADPIRYKSPLGSAEQRGAVYPYNYDDSTNDYVITEGEIKAGISSQIGVPTLALPGISTWRSMLTNHRRDRQVIVFDSVRLASSREITFRAIDKLANKLYNPYVVVLPLLGEDKMDIDRFILRRGPEEYRTIIQNALTYSEWALLQRRRNVH